MYLILAKHYQHFGTNQLFPLLNYLINNIITCHFSYHTSPLSYIIYQAYWLSGWYHYLGLIKGMI